MKYSEKNKKEVFDWFKFLKPRKKHSYGDLYHACNLAAAWVTCACGQQCNNLPRNSDGAPLDNKLAEFGRAFYRYIKKMYDANTFSSYEENRLKAKQVLISIEKRTNTLLSNDL